MGVITIVQYGNHTKGQKDWRETATTVLQNKSAPGTGKHLQKLRALLSTKVHFLPCILSIQSVLLNASAWEARS